MPELMLLDRRQRAAAACIFCRAKAPTRQVPAHKVTRIHYRRGPRYPHSANRATRESSSSANELTSLATRRPTPPQHCPQENAVLSRPDSPKSLCHTQEGQHPGLDISRPQKGPQPLLLLLLIAPRAAKAKMAALFNFQSLLLVILLLICTSTYVHAIFPALLDNRKEGFMGIFWKSARVGERLSPYISICCVAMAVSVFIGN
ncbi:hypothetical protein MAPG_08536 [Magnaporthiopsis poae ATCC 64411]|uniref:Protein kish n=1 Tax=Magnaporthiopsis poae (strain ATCC 64411 / 73-15) TaxID=644358 RepID=A0A0C4E7M1_MAGP6|nr:hypothetical protein MAPG_08536 [Magnaporthiopsis poae ATCC 64411]